MHGIGFIRGSSQSLDQIEFIVLPHGGTAVCTVEGDTASARLPAWLPIINMTFRGGGKNQGLDIKNNRF